MSIRNLAGWNSSLDNGIVSACGGEVQSSSCSAQQTSSCSSCGATSCSGGPYIEESPEGFLENPQELLEEL